MIPHILIIDGDRVAAETTAALVHHLAPLASIACVATAAQGLRCVAEQRPVLLIIDPSLSSEADQALIRAAKAQRAQVLVIASRAGPGLRRQVEALGINGYLQKPVLPTQLAAQILALLTTRAAAGSS